MPNPTRFAALRMAAASIALLAAFAGTARAQASQPDEPDTQPVLLTRDLPRITMRAYPQEMRARKIPASVEVNMLIQADGRVDTTTVNIVSTTNLAFNVPASRVVAQMRFRPATLAGQAVPVWVTVAVNFAAWSDGTSTRAQRDDRLFPGNNARPRR